MKSSLTSLLLLLLITSSPLQNLFAAGKPPGKVIWQIEEQFISLVSQDDANAVENNHPARVPIDTLAEMIYAVSVSDKKSRFSFGGKRADLGRPLFSVYEIEVLSGLFADALAAATPEQDILFRIHGGKEQLGGITSRKTINTGRAFWQDNRLHIIFGEVHGGDKTKWLYGQKQKDTYVRKFGSRTSASDRVKVVFAPVAGITQYKDSSGRIRTDWISIDADIILGKAETEPTQARLEQQPAASTPSTTDTPQTVAAPNSAISAEQERSFILKLRLKELKELRDDGLITEELYQQKTKEVLDKSL